MKIYKKIKKILKSSIDRKKQHSNQVNLINNQVNLISNQTNQISNQTNQISNQTNQISNQTNQISNQTNQISNQTNQISNQTNQIIKKISMVDNIWQIGNTKFYIPNYPLDYIQKDIVDRLHFYEEDILKELTPIIGENITICDIGSNIGNHTLYWLTRGIAKHVYCFEPRIETFDILKKNISINKLESLVTLFNIALSSKEEQLSVSHFRESNIGGNTYTPDTKGLTRSISLDSLDIKEKVDFIKIDVEGMEKSVLKGSKHFLQKNKPLIFIEVFKNNYQETNKILTEYGYSMIKEFKDSNYLYKVI